MSNDVFYLPIKRSCYNIGHEVFNKQKSIINVLIAIIFFIAHPIKFRVVISAHYFLTAHADYVPLILNISSYGERFKKSIKLTLRTLQEYVQ